MLPAIRIPDEIRKYKEKIIFGLNARQILSVVVVLIIGLPLYWFGKDYLHEELLSWLLIFLGAACFAVGWLPFNGMPAEKFVVEWFKFEVLFPRKRTFKSENAFRTWNDMAVAEEQPKTNKERKRLKEMKEQETWEKLFLLDEAEKNGKAVYLTDPNAEKAFTFDMDAQELLTVSVKNNSPKKKPDNKKPKKKKETKSKLQRQAEAIEEKQKNNPQYVPTKKEYKILKDWKKKQLDLRKQEIIKGKKALQEKNNKMKKRRTAKISIPKSTQQSIPYIADYEEGMFEVEPNKFSKMYRIKDINYFTSKEEEQVAIFCKLRDFLNYFSEEMRIAIVVDNRVISKAEQERKLLKKMMGDKDDGHRKEYNRVLKKQLHGGRNNMQIQKFLTVTIDANEPMEALMRFHRIDAEVVSNLRRIGSDGVALTTDERLEYYHDKFRKGHEGELITEMTRDKFYEFIMAQGLSSKDYIAPSYMLFESKHIQIEDEYYRCLFLNNLPASLQDDFLNDLYDNDFPLTVSLQIEPVAAQKGLRIVRKQLTGIEKDKMVAERRAIKDCGNPDMIKHSIKDAHKQAEALYDDMMSKDQKLFFVSISVMVHGSTLEELDTNCAVLMGKAQSKGCQLRVLKTQQEELYKITLPFGYNPNSSRIRIDRSLTSESTAVFMPFANQELFQDGGFFYGLNPESQNVIVVNRTNMKNASGWILGSSGSGKSFAAKSEIMNVLLTDKRSSVIIIDPENEYGSFGRAFGGTVIKISADSMNFINPMDMSENYGLDEDDDPERTPLDVKKSKAIRKKSDFILSIVERMISVGGSADASTLTAQQKTIIDRSVRAVYQEYLHHDFDPDYIPTLLDLQEKLDEEKEISEDGRKVAEGVELYTKGSLDVFAHKTNVEITNRFIVFNVRDLGGQLSQIALTIMFDFIWNSMVENKNKGVRTYAYCDEAHVLFRSYYSAEFLRTLYKRGRKYGLIITSITQNCTELLASEQAKTMINNSDFVMMLNQKHDDLATLAEMLDISETQMGFVSSVDAGEGLIYAEKIIVPFINRFPKDSYLYDLISTKFGEEDKISDAEVNEKIKKIIERREKMDEEEVMVEEPIGRRLFK